MTKYIARKENIHDGNTFMNAVGKMHKLVRANSEQIEIEYDTPLLPVEELKLQKLLERMGFNPDFTKEL